MWAGGRGGGGGGMGGEGGGGRGADAEGWERVREVVGLRGRCDGGDEVMGGEEMWMGRGGGVEEEERVQDVEGLRGRDVYSRCVHAFNHLSGEGLRQLDCNGDVECKGGRLSDGVG